MFEWNLYAYPEYSAVSDRGSIFYICPVDPDDPGGPWTCGGTLWNGEMYAPREFSSKKSAQNYAEELEIQAEVE